MHWTPRRWAGKELNSTLRTSYVEHLKSLCLSGLHFSKPQTQETIRGFNRSADLPTLPIVCFTELRLSMVEKHINTYGSLGLGFRRSYLMERGANPVFYLQNANQGIVNTNLQGLTEQVDNVPGLPVFLSYIKKMSSEVGGDLDLYDEMEWRIVGCNLAGWSPFKKDGDNFTLDFRPQDVEIIVFPDAATREAAFADSDITDFFRDGTPMTLDAPDVGNI